MNTPGTPLPAPPAEPSRDLYLRAFQGLLLARALDDKLASLYRGGKISGGLYLGRGQEALSAAIGILLQPGDVFAPLIRDLAGRLAFGETVLEVLQTYLGSPLGPMRGRDGNVHRGRPRAGLLPMVSHLGAMVSVVNGILFARAMKGIPGSIGVASLGDGATSTGASHEGLNQAAVERLPLVAVVANNQYAYSTPVARQYACASLVDRAVGYGFQGTRVDGTDLMACLRALGGAFHRARQGGGPQMVVGDLLRLCGHGEHDDGAYMDLRLREAPFGQDCLKQSEAFLRQSAWATAQEIEEWRSRQIQAVEEALNLVQHDPPVDPYREAWQALSTGPGDIHGE
jgi:pyruvate dehydrogenase E1 component alpha subunit/2-oxoisovalerate dehydrogenase E1 component alpha subunit